MAQLTKDRLTQILVRALKPDEPDVRLEKAGGRFSGDVVSASFKGKRDHERQKMIWDALDAALGAESVQKVGLLLAYTPDEWEMGRSGTPESRKRKAG